MTPDESKPLAPSVVKRDLDTVTALATITDYDPGDETEVSLAAMQQTATQLTQDEADELRKFKAWQAARDKTVATQWKLHKGSLRVKEKVIGQFGGSSDEAQTIGLKKKSERKKPGPKKPTP